MKHLCTLSHMEQLQQVTIAMHEVQMVAPKLPPPRTKTQTTMELSSLKNGDKVANKHHHMSES